MTVTVGGVVLGAGVSSRFDSGNKLLAAVDGTPLLRRVTETALASGLDETVVVLGHEADTVAETLSGVPVSTWYNDEYAAGQSTSVRCGVAAARAAGWDGVVVVLGDMPFVDAATIDELLAAYRSGAGRIVAPQYEGRRGNPVLFDRTHFDALGDISGDRGGRALIRDCPDVALVDTDDSGVVRDIDTRTDLDGHD